MGRAECPMRTLVYEGLELTMQLLPKSFIDPSFRLFVKPTVNAVFYRGWPVSTWLPNMRLQRRYNGALLMKAKLCTVVVKALVAGM
jgi:hypothetical protein